MTTDANDNWNVRVSHGGRKVDITDMGSALMILMDCGPGGGFKVSLNWPAAQLLYEALGAAITHGEQSGEMEG